MLDYRMHIRNEERLKNADIIAGISKRSDISSTVVINNIIKDFVIFDEPNAKAVNISEEDIKKLYPHDRSKVVFIAKHIFLDFRQNDDFNKRLKAIKGNKKFHHVRYLDPGNPKSQKKDLYNWSAFKELARHYTLLPSADLTKLHEDSRFT